jgi:hypothetical protein
MGLIKSCRVRKKGIYSKLLSIRYGFFSFSNFLIFALCVKIVAPAPIHAVTIPIIAAMTVGFSNALPEEDGDVVDSRGVTGTGVIAGRDAVATMI